MTTSIQKRRVETKESENNDNNSVLLYKYEGDWRTRPPARAHAHYRNKIPIRIDGWFFPTISPSLSLPSTMTEFFAACPFSCRLKNNVIRIHVPCPIFCPAPWITSSVGIAQTEWPIFLRQRCNVAAESLRGYYRSTLGSKNTLRWRRRRCRRLIIIWSARRIITTKGKRWVTSRICGAGSRRKIWAKNLRRRWKIDATYTYVGVEKRETAENR